MEELLQLAARYGIHANRIEVLSDRSTLVLDLLGSEVVARIHKNTQGKSSADAYARLEAERSIALELAKRGLRVVEPIANVEVIRFENSYASFWRKEAIVDATISGRELADAVIDLEDALVSPIPHLKVLPTWDLASDAAERALRSDDEHLRAIGESYKSLDRQIRSEQLWAAHGDAHPGNLSRTERGWTWFDLEDVGMMPAYWDVATAVARSVLLGWHVEVSVDALRRYAELRSDVDWSQFMRTLTARCVQVSLLCWDAAEDLQEDELIQARIEGANRILSEPDFIVGLLVPTR